MYIPRLTVIYMQSKILLCNYIQNNYIYISMKRTIAYDLIVRRRNENYQHLKIFDAEFFLETRS